MIIRVHGFDWGAYREQVMPAFAAWLIEQDSSAVQRLFEQSHYAYEERFLPAPLQRVRALPRASIFVDSLPRGQHSRREYQVLCSAEQFTAVSDQYVYIHVPRLYHSSDALCSIWSALVETYCLPWNDELEEETAPESSAVPDTPTPDQPASSTPSDPESEEATSEELASLLNAAGLNELARSVNEQAIANEEPESIMFVEEDDLFYDDGEEYASPTEPEDEGPSMLNPLAHGILLGRHPNSLRLRGWLARSSLRALALFELLACGRRALPFGSETDEPFSSFIGYLTPDEVKAFAACLHTIRPPRETEAENDYRDFRLEQAGRRKGPRLLDEVLPTHADNLLLAVHAAALEGLGLICSAES